MQAIDFQILEDFFFLGGIMSCVWTWWSLDMLDRWYSFSLIDGANHLEILVWWNNLLEFVWRLIYPIPYDLVMLQLH